MNRALASRGCTLRCVTDVSALPPILQDLLNPAAYRHAVGNIEVRETHMSWVLLTGAEAYKIKKPVKLDFVDMSTLERRRQLCDEELRLNRRLVPELYLGVVPIVQVGGRATVDAAGPAVEYAVRMKQFAASDELQTLLVRNAVDAAQMAALGELLAKFHASAAVAPGTRAPERTQRLFQTVLDNLAQLLAHLRNVEPSAHLEPLIDWTHGSATALEPVLQSRERHGFVRECHGDLHTGNIVRLHDRLAPFDCIEFDPDLRWIDVMNDVSFLVMDLISHERRDLACALLSTYLEVGGDYEGVRAVPFYAVYRALVRAKVDALAIEQVPARAAELRPRLQQRIAAARWWTSRRHPTLILMHGASGSGKSWLSERLVPHAQVIRIRSDLERKRLAGIEPGQAAAAGVRKGIYAPQVSERTYARLAECAACCLHAGLSVVVDATFLELSHRAAFRTLAERIGASFVMVSCQADRDTLAERVRKRSIQRADASDADLAILETQLREMKPLDAGEQRYVIVANMAEPDVVARVTASLTARMQ
jgi:aminoglycoside phosphotransferase family enzyme/predicted kinase